uniref:50S ribosomal protein L1 n=1 Tax=Meloidogyne hapla TaxID=6305 RepID=A0A1I8BG53_MELHA
MSIKRKRRESFEEYVEGTFGTPQQMEIASISDDVSRHNSPSNAYAISREVKAIKSVKGVKVKMNV